MFGERVPTPQPPLQNDVHIEATPSIVLIEQTKTKENKNKEKKNKQKRNKQTKLTTKKNTPNKKRKLATK